MHRIDASGYAAGNVFTDGNPATGVPATVVDAAWLNNIQETLAQTIEAAGLTLAKGDYTQLIKALIVNGMQGSYFNVAAASGTANAITATYTPVIAALVNGMALYVRASSANTSATPTFTPNSGLIAAKTIVKGAGQALAAGDIAGGGHWIELQYDATLDKWVLQNPATGVSASTRQIQPITASVASNALTLTLNPTSLDFRSSTLGSGTINTRTIASVISVVVPSSATLGTANAMAARLAVLAIDNAGTVELAVVNLAGGNNLDETTLISTTAISAAATANNVIYSTTARTNVPFRVVGFVDITEATAGTWATAPSTIQGIGGQALAAMSSLGYGQTWQSVTRTAGTTYYNTTGKPILFNASVPGSSAPTLTINGVIAAQTSTTAGTGAFLSAIIPPGASYSYSSSLSAITELR